MPESGWDGGMPGVAELAGLTLPAVRRAPEGVLRLIADHVHAAPEGWGDPCVGGVAHHAASPAALDLPSDLAAELKVETLVVNRPRAVGVHQDPVVGRFDHRLERGLAGEEPDVGHPHHGEAVVPIGADHAARRGEAGKGSAVTAREHTDPTPFADDVDALGGRALVVIAERAEGPGEGGIGGDVHEARAEDELSSLFDVEP